MRILAIYKYYWPDKTPYARILKAILEHWIDQGHEATVLTAQPGYNDVRQPRQPWRETLGGVDVHRLRTPREPKRNAPRRLLSFLVFLVRAVWRACREPRPDLIIVNPHPPVLMGLAVRLIRRLRGVPFVYHCQDIHPESSRVMGHMENPVLYRLLRRLDTANCQAAALIVTLSEDMVATLRARGVPREKILVINNFILGEDEDLDSVPPFLPDLLPDAEGAFVLLFAGNLGRFQALDHFIQTARLLAEERDIKFVFMGEGVMKEPLQQLAGNLAGRTVFFCSYQPLPVARRAMAEADLSLVSLGPGVHRVAYPSKTMNCLAAGSPVLAIVESDSVLARDIMNHGLGDCRAQGDHAGTAAAIREARARRDEWRRRRPAIAAWARERFGQAAILMHWTDVPLRVRAGWPGD
jgi:glycosyltransferase involved in cell wall biosynthesis